MIQLSSNILFHIICITCKPYLKVLTLKYWNCFAWTVGWKCNEKLVCEDILSIELSGPHMLSSKWTDKTISTSLNVLNSQTYHTIIKHILIFNSTRLFCRQELMSGAHFQAIFITDKKHKACGKCRRHIIVYEVHTVIQR